MHSLCKREKTALVFLSVWGLSFYVHFGVHVVVSGWWGCLHLHGAREYPDTLKPLCAPSKSCYLVNPFLKPLFSSCWGSPLPHWAQSPTMGSVSPSSATSPWTATPTRSSTTQVCCGHIPMRSLVIPELQNSLKLWNKIQSYLKRRKELGFGGCIRTNMISQALSFPIWDLHASNQRKLWVHGVLRCFCVCTCSSILWPLCCGKSSGGAPQSLKVHWGW